MAVRFLLAHGARDTLIGKPGAEYDGIDFAGILERVRNPRNTDKLAADFIIPSTYRGHDGRAHDVQRERGAYRMLAVDIDKGSPTKAAVIEGIQAVCGEVSIIVYSSSGASKTERKWRALIPVAGVMSGDDYEAAQAALFDLLAAHGLQCDPALARCGQPVFLPNVPPDRRGEDGKPIFYDFQIVRAHSLDLSRDNLISAAIADRERQEAEAAEAAEAARLERERERAKRRIERPHDFEPVTEFCARYTIGELLDRYGYERRGSSAHYRSRYQASGSFATRDYGSHWVSLSGSDAAAGLGKPKSLGKHAYTWGDAFDLFAHYEHGGDFTKAVRAFAAEVKAQSQFAPVPDLPRSSPLDDFDIVPDAPAPAADVAPGDNAPPPDAFDIEEPAVADQPAAYPTLYTQFSEAAVEPRRWIYGRHYLRSFVSVLAASGASGKTSLQTAEALAICTGKPLLGERVHEACKVWIVNLEDPIDEMQRRILATMRHYGLTEADIAGRLYMDAGRDFSLCLGMQTRDGVVPNVKLVEYLERRITELGIGCVFIDPFVSAHAVNENDNMAISAVVSQIRAVADRTRAAIGLVHHVRKGQMGEEASIDSVRGAGSLIGAARAARVINRVSLDTATKLGIPADQARGIIRVDDGKANLAPPADEAVYRRMIGVQIDNGDFVGVCIPFELPDVFDGITGGDLRKVQIEINSAAARNEYYRADVQAENWVGGLVARIVGLDAGEDTTIERIKKVVKTWISNGSLRIEKVSGVKRGREVPVIVVGEMVSADEIGGKA